MAKVKEMRAAVTPGQLSACSRSQEPSSYDAAALGKTLATLPRSEGYECRSDAQVSVKGT